MPLRFVGGEQLQRGRGIGGIFRFIKSIFAPAVKTVGKSVVGAVKSTTGKKILNVVFTLIYHFKMKIWSKFDEITLLQSFWIAKYYIFPTE